MKTLFVSRAVGLLLVTLWITACTQRDKPSEAAGSPSSSIISPLKSDALLVVNGGSNSISVIDTETNSLSQTIQLKNIAHPHHISMSPDKKSLVVAVPGMDLSGGHDTTSTEDPATEGHNGGHGGLLLGEESEPAILVLDATTGETKASRFLDEMNHNGAFAPNGEEIWTSAMAATGKVLVLNKATLEIEKEITVGKQPAEITFSNDGAYAFVANGASDSVSVIDVSSKAVKKTITVGDNPVGAWPGSDSIMYVDNEKGQSISAIDASTLEVVRSYSLGFTPAMAATAPNGDLWVTDDTNGKVVMFAASTTTKIGEIATGDGAHGIAFSADGKKAYVTNQRADTVSVIDVAAVALEKSIEVGSQPNGLLFLPK